MKTAHFNLQPEVLENEIIKIIPLQEDHFEALYEIASDPLVWEQHPVKNRYEKDVFKTFFEGAVSSKGSFLILDQKTNEVIGTTRFYDYNPEKSNVGIGYTFIGRKFWGGPYNAAAKKLLIDYAFKTVDSILFHVGEENIRSQKAVLKLGAIKINDIFFPHNGIDLPYFEYELVKSK